MGKIRIKFEKGKQREFFDLVMEKLLCPNLRSLNQFGLNIPYSTLRHYYYGERNISEGLFNDLCFLSKINSFNFKVEHLQENWGAIKGGKIGIRKLREKYPKKIIEWRKLAIKNRSEKFTKKIKVPDMSLKLSEFVGIYLGDGTLTEYFIKISGDSRYDKRYFEYIHQLVEDTFGISGKISIEKNKNTLLLTFHSKELCNFLKERCHLNFGDKVRNQSCIPEEILKENSLSLACLRGLIDTDGCISRRGRKGEQFCLQFFNQNEKLLNQVDKIGRENGFFTYRTGNEIGTNRWLNVEKYFRETGSSNMKHIVRFLVRKKDGKSIYLRDVLNYYEKPLYKNIKLPFLLTP